METFFAATLNQLEDASVTTDSLRSDLCDCIEQNINIFIDFKTCSDTVTATDHFLDL